jgi:photosystem II stability/assembly factor-like uncharacterized protein
MGRDSLKHAARSVCVAQRLGLLKGIRRVWVLGLVLGFSGPLASLAAPGWSWQNPLPQGNTLLGVSVLDANTLIAVGAAGTAMKTTDGGATWAVQHYAGGGLYLSGVS